MDDIVNKIIRDVKMIPPMSRTASELLNVTMDESHTVDDIVKVVASDPMLAGQLLKIANSAAYARRTVVDSIATAVSYLGNKLVVGIALGASCACIYESELEGYESSEGDLWLHSLRTAIASKEFAKYTAKNVDTNVAYTAGLLHDIGKAILSAYLMDKLDEVREIFASSVPADFLQVEKQLVGVNHCEIGEILGKHWNLPDTIKYVIRYHHHPHLAPADYRAICYTIHLADTVAMMAGNGTGVDSLHYSLDTSYDQYVHIDRNELDRMLLMLGLEFGKTASALDETKKI